MKNVKHRWILGALAALTALALAEALFGQKYFFRVKTYRIGHSEGSRKLRLLLLTDLHLRNRLWPFHYRLLRTINKLRPDLLLLSGDIIDQWGTIAPAKQFFSRLDRNIPLLAIPGNHDNKNVVSRAALRRLLEAHNGRLLVNETVQLRLQGIPLTVTGLDDFIEGEADLFEALRGTGREPHHLLLVHSPLQQEEVKKELERINRMRPAEGQVAFGYIFAGHNHGGQVRLGPLVPVLPECAGNYVNGWYNETVPFLFVSKGFGTSSIPFRFGARSEIVLFEYGVKE
jgi:predicted MPP superfamily phosphohydrolase